MNEKLEDFIEKARSENASDEEITKILLEQGWKLKEIQPLLGSGSLKGLKPPTPFNQSDSSLGMWDAFQHVLMFISLYVMSTSIAMFLHYYIDYWQLGMPFDLGMYGNPKSSANSAIISALSASLLVSYPFFAFFFISVNKRKLEMPEILKLKLRKVLIYLTLIATFIITLCHLIYLVFQVLMGFVNLNASLHFLVTLSVSGSIFAYFLNEVRHDRAVKE